MCKEGRELMESNHAKLYEEIYDEVIALPNDPHAGLMYWRLKKQTLSTTPIDNLEWVNVDEDFDPYDSTNEFFIDDDGLTIATPLHFTNQLKRIPRINVPSERKIMQMALNSAQAVRSGFQEFKYGFYDIVRKS